MAWNSRRGRGVDKMDVSSKKIFTACFLALCILPLVFVGQVEKSLWLDEAALALNVLDKSFLELFQPLQYAQSAPPLFLCLTKVLVSIFGPGERVLRFIPFFCSLASIVAFWFLVDEVFVKKDDFCPEKRPLTPFFGTAIFAFSFPFLYNSLEFKPYSLDVLFTILTFLIWLKVLRHKVSFKKELAFVLLLSTFPLFSFASIFSLCAVLALSLPVPGVNTGKERKIIPVVLGVSFVLYYIFIFSKINSGTNVYKYWISYFINHNFLKGFSVFFEILKYHFFPSSVAAFAFILFILGLIYLCKNREEVFSIFSVTLFSALAASWYDFYPLFGRLSLFLYPVFLVALLSPLGFCSKMSAKSKIAAILSALFLLSTVFYNPFNDILYKREEIKPLLKVVQGEIKPGDRIFVFKGAHLTYRYYLKTPEFKALDGFETFVCPYNIQAKACADRIKPFCAVAINRGNSCYVIHSSEVNTLKDLRPFEISISRLNGKIMQKDKNSVLYEISPVGR